MLKMVICEVLVPTTGEFAGKTLYFAGIEGGPSHLVKAFTKEAALQYGFEYAKTRWGQTETGEWTPYVEKWAATWPYKAEALAYLAGA